MATLFTSPLCPDHGYFTQQMLLAVHHPNFQFHPHCKELRLSHLMFAGDVIIFSKAHPPTLSFIMDTLQEFHRVMGLKANQLKSQAIFGGCSEALQATCLQTMRFQEGSLPLRYLGIPVIASQLIKIECRALVEKIMGRVR